MCIRDRSKVDLIIDFPISLNSPLIGTNNPNLILLWASTLVELDELKKINRIIILTNILILMLLLIH